MKTKIQWPWSYHRLEKLRRELFNQIESQLNAAGIKTQRKRPGLRIEIAGKDMRVWLTYYRDQRWWRLTCGYGSNQPGFEYTITPTNELTMLFEEIDGSIGRHLVALLCDPHGYQWPLFAGYQSYPGYAWSKAGWAAIEADSEQSAMQAAKGGH